MSRTRQQGLFAFDAEEFHFHYQEAPDLDHVGWFSTIGLPSSGPEYDALLRGKVTYDIDTDQVVVGFYGTAYLSNRRYARIVECFGIDEAHLIEKMLNEPY